jgi:PST family polysaccharide transporter
MNIKKTFLFTSIHTFVKVIVGLIINKVIAVYLGPSGLALYGQFQNFVTIIYAFSSGSIHSGIVKYTAEYHNNKNSLLQILKSALVITLVANIIVLTILLIFSGFFAGKILFDEKFQYVLIMLAFFTIFNSLNLYLLSFLNGLGEITLFTICNILISIITLVVTVILTVQFNIEGTLISLILIPFITSVIMYLIIFKKYWHVIKENSRIENFIDISMIKKLMLFAIITFSSGITVSITMLCIRYNIEGTLSLHDAGVWEGAWRLVLYFNMVFALPVSIYYIPKFAQTHDNNIIKKNLNEIRKIFFPLSILLAGIIYISSPISIPLLFSESFLNIKIILVFILSAEIIRIQTMAISNLFQAKARIWVLLSNDILFSIVFIFSSYIGVVYFGFVGLGYAYLISAVISFISYQTLLYKKFNFQEC